MKSQIKRLSLAALLLTGAGLAVAGERTASVGDLPASAVGDLPGYSEAAYFHDDAAYGVGVEKTNHQTKRAAMPQPHKAAYRPIGTAELQASSFAGGHGFGSCDSCDGACDGGCDSGFGGKRGHKICGIFDRCSDDTWATAEFLMWFAQDREMIPLVTTSDPGTASTMPSAGQPNPNNVQVVFGDDLDGELSGGFRTDVGKWVTDRVGVGGRFWIMAQNDDSISLAGDGTGTSIGRPFFNLSAPGGASEDSVIINNDGTGALAQFSGAVSARSALNIWAAEAYSRIRFTCNRHARVEFIGGYSHFDINDELAISSRSLQLGGTSVGQITTFADVFESDNRFDGGQLGFETIVNRGKWSVRSLTKVHLGNMQQSVSIAGSSTVVTPPAAPTEFGSGFLARDQSGTYERDVFAFVPEANFKLAYQMRKNMQFSVGYSFIYWDNVVLNGDVVDRVISDGQAGAGGVRPQFAFDDSSLWVQGLDLGIAINY